MSYETDFRGDRLRLHAFLRVVDDGLPKRPSRFRRRFLAVSDDLEASSHSISDYTNDTVASVQEASHEGPLNDVSFLDGMRPPNPEQPLPAFEEQSLVTAEDSVQQRGYEQVGCASAKSNQQTEKRASDQPVTAATKAHNKLRKTPSTRHRRRIPVNELALLRTTSSDGLPQPRDADNIFAAPVTADDPIEDSQVVSRASLGASYKLLAFNRVRKSQKQTTIGTANAGLTKRSGLISRGPFGNTNPAQPNRVSHKKPSTSNFVKGSDGFVGAELSIQHTKRLVQSRSNNKILGKKYAPASAGLILVHGHLPTPLVEHHVRALSVQHRMTSQAQSRMHEMQPLSERALSEIQRALSEREARERHGFGLQQCKSLVHDQLSNITAPTGRVSGVPTSKGHDEEHVPCNMLYSHNDDRHDATRPSHPLPLARVPTFSTDTSCLETAIYIVDAPHRSDRVDEDS
ncbi:hypothetical protein EKO04_007363 [Ascochyta lentis]|uniref:Uncharacterized protein n=1 Tax=Ascochyta lentis TaxID=205686 RepID=A0A8H7MCK8_9PLEO|nr:hypothetical protein EKO04_007363 [Ascochyta lentis]